MELRFQPDQPVTVSILDAKRTVCGHIVSLQNRVARLRFDEPLQFDAPLRIDFDDTMILAEVTSCVPDGASFVATLDMVECVPRMSDLGRLVRAVMQQSPRESIAVERTAARTAISIA